MELTDLKLTVVAFARSLLEGQIPAEEVTKKFLYEYLPPKIKNHLHELPYYDCKEEAHIIYTILYEWLMEEDKVRSGYGQLSDEDLYEKVKNRIITYLKGRVPNHYANLDAETPIDGGIEFNKYGNELFPVGLFSESDKIEIDEDEKDIIDEPQLEIFIAGLYRRPELLIKEIEKKCTEPTVREYLVKTFPSVDAFCFLIHGNQIFMRDLQLRNVKDKFFKDIKNELSRIEIFDRMHNKTGQELEKEMKKLIMEYRRRGVNKTRLSLRTTYQSVSDDLKTKFGYVKLVSEITLRVADEDIKSSFEQFARQLYCDQKARTAN